VSAFAHPFDTNIFNQSLLQVFHTDMRISFVKASPRLFYTVSVNESCLTCQNVVFDMSQYVSHVNESCLTCKWVMSHMSMSHVSHVNESCLTCQCVMSHMLMSHISHV